MSLQLSSIHFPKTGGMSIRNILKARFGPHLQFSYPGKSFQERPQGIAKWAKAWKIRRSHREAHCVHGHYHASVFARSNAQLVTFVRSPIERAASLWHFVHRRAPQQGIRNPTWQTALDTSLEDFVLTPSQDYRWYFGDISMDRFAFIGSMDDFEDDQRRFAQWLEVPFEIAEVNRNPAGSEYDFSSELMRKHRALNAAEYEIYEAALRRRDSLLKAPVAFNFARACE